MRLAIASILVYSIIFLALAVLPLDPARSALGPLADQEAVKAYNARYGFDRPILERYVRVAAGLLRGDFGMSATWGRPVASLLGSSLVSTIVRLFIALGLGLLLARALTPLTVAKNLRIVRACWMAAASVPSFVALVLILAVVGTGAARPPSTNRWLYEVLAIGWASAFSASVVCLSILDRLDFRNRRSRQAEFLLYLRAPPGELVGVLMRGAWPTAFATAANSATGSLTALAFAEYVFDLPGFSIAFFRACEHGDLSVICFGSLFLAWLFLALHLCAETAAGSTDSRLR